MMHTHTFHLFPPPVKLGAGLWVGSDSLILGVITLPLGLDRSCTSGEEWTWPRPLQSRALTFLPRHGSSRNCFAVPGPLLLPNFGAWPLPVMTTMYTFLGAERMRPPPSTHSTSSTFPHNTVRSLAEGPHTFLQRNLAAVWSTSTKSSWSTEVLRPWEWLMMSCMCLTSERVSRGISFALKLCLTRVFPRVKKNSTSSLFWKFKHTYTCSSELHYLCHV